MITSVVLTFDVATVQRRRAWRGTDIMVLGHPARDWCYENCKGLWSWRRMNEPAFSLGARFEFRFQSETDALLFKMFWQ